MARLTVSSMVFGIVFAATGLAHAQFKSTTTVPSIRLSPPALGSSGSISGTGSIGSYQGSGIGAAPSSIPPLSGAVSSSGGSGPSPQTSGLDFKVVVCVGFDNEDCVSGANLGGKIDRIARWYIERTTVRLARYKFVNALRVRFPTEVAMAEQKQWIFKLEREIISVAVSLMRTDVQRLEPFKWDSANRYVNQWEERAVSQSNMPSNYSHNTSTNTTTYTRTPDLMHAWTCVGAGNKPGCNWDGARGQTLHSR